MGDVPTQNEGVYLQRLNEVETTLKHVDAKLAKIYIAVIGDEKFDQKGIIDRLKKAESKIDEFSVLKNKLAGAFVVGGAVWTFIWEMIRPLLLKN